MICEQGDIVSLDFSPSERHEPAGRHFGIVISPFEVNTRSALTVLVPVTSNNNGYPLHVRIADGNPVHGFAQCEALRAMDLDSREIRGKAELIGSIDDATMGEIMSMVAIVVGLGA